jgi:DNA-directed RNA polymerase subunit RPC12/RpoP
MIEEEHNGVLYSEKYMACEECGHKEKVRSRPIVVKETDW